MQQECDVVGGGEPGDGRLAAQRALQRERPRAGLALRVQLEDRDAELRGDIARERGSRLDHQRLGLEVGEGELELFRAVSGIERRGGSAGGDTDEGGGHLRPVAQDDGDAVAAAQAEGVEPRDGALHLRAQLSIGERRDIIGRADGPRGIVAAQQQFGEGIHGPIHRAAPPGTSGAFSQPASR